jgi:ATP-dependent protease HslVU (ClpYQ) peptidase subunit
VRTIEPALTVRITQLAALLRDRQVVIAGGGQILVGHTKIESTVRYLGVAVEDALTLAEHTEV